MRAAWLWHFIAYDTKITSAFVKTLRKNVTKSYGQAGPDQISRTALWQSVFPFLLTGGFFVLSSRCMKILTYSTLADATRAAAEAVIEQMAQKADSVLGLATGATMEPVYERLAEAHAAGRVSFTRAISFNLDEYTGLAADHPGSFRRFMVEHFFSKTDFIRENAFAPNGAAADPEAEAARYEALLAERGPVDLQFLGLGANGHIGFNEPGAGADTRTRAVTLTPQTRKANERFFPDGAGTPERAVTVGIQNILEARKIILLAAGPEKASAAAAMAEGPPEPRCPASALQAHPDVTVMLDKAAAAALKKV